MVDRRSILTCRNFTADDIKRYLEISAEVWSPEHCATREQVERRLRVYPQGILCAVVDEELQGVVTTVRVDYDLTNPPATWAEATDSGFIARVYRPQGNALFGVDLSVSGRAPLEVSPFLLDAVKELVRRMGVEYIVFGARIPYYDKFCQKQGEVQVEEYVHGRTESGRPLDPEIAFYLRHGGRIVRILPNYFPDPPSRNYGVLMVWYNDQRA